MSDFQFPGLNIALATPFDANGQIAFGQLEENIERYIEAGIQGFLLSSGTGIHVYLTPEESAELVARGACCPSLILQMKPSLPMTTVCGGFVGRVPVWSVY